jgi:hypothetical protein
VPDSLFGKLAGRAGHAVVMALDASRRVENRAQSTVCVVFPFKLRLIQEEGIARRLRYTVADALRTGSHCQLSRWSDRRSERGGSEAGWRLSPGLLRNKDNCGAAGNKKGGDSFVCHVVYLLRRRASVL